MSLVAVSPLQDILRDLKQFISYPTISSDPQRRHVMQDCCSWLKDYLQGIGMQRAFIFTTSTHPLVFAEYLSDPSLPTILFYGHYDVQPVDPLGKWIHPPFQAVIRGDYVYGRGASDDKGQIFIQLAAIAGMIRSGALSVNVKFLIEGAEEIGSEGLRDFILRERALLACDAIFVSDTSMASLSTPAITYALRGSLNVELTIQTLRQDLHSGTFGGRVPNAANILSGFLGRLFRPDGTINIPGFYADVTAVANGGKPALSITGLIAGHQGKGVKSVIPSVATAKLNLRLVPNQQPEKVRALLDRHIREKLPDAKIAVKYSAPANPVVISRGNSYVRAAVKACEKTFGKKPVFVSSGGTIAAVDLLHSLLAAPAVLLGFAQESDSRHAPNEKFYLPNFIKGIRTIVQFLKYVRT